MFAQAGRDLTLDAGQARQSYEQASHIKSRRTLSKKTTTTYDHVEQSTAQASTFSAETVDLVASRDLPVRGFDVVSSSGTALAAARDVTIEAATESVREQHFKETKKSGVFSSGASLTFGKQQHSTDAELSHTTARASTVGSVEGHVLIQAGGTYRQTGSDVLAPQGNLDIAAQRLEITEAAETHTSRTEQRFKQSGLSVGAGGALVAAAQTTAQMAQAAQRTSDARMQALAAAAAGLHLYNNAGEIGKAAEALGQGDVSAAASLQISVGSAHSHSVSHTQATEARASTVAAGGDVRLRASGVGSDSDLLVRGSEVHAGGSARLYAEGDIDLVAAERTRRERSEQRSSSAGVGVSVGASTGVTASASRGRGHSKGDETAWRNAHVQAGQQVSLASGADTTLRGAVVAAEQIHARVGGNLTVQSLQDAATYDEKHRQAGGSVTLGPSPGASLSASSTRLRSDYASVTEQSALRAGDGGFDVQVAGTTRLAGGAITSTDAAVQQGRNRFDSQALILSDLHNHASYDAQSSGISVGVGGGKLGGTAGIGQASGQANSTTQAAISGIAGKQEARTGDAETGLAPIFDRERIKQDVQAQVAITAEFGKQATAAVSSYVQEERKAIRRRMEEAKSDAERAALDQELKDLAMQERALNILIGALVGLGPSATLKEGLDAAADEMRRLMIEDSKKFAGITDGTTTLSNASGQSEGLDGDQFKLGGTRLDLDVLCGPDNRRCKIAADGSLLLNEQGLVQLDEEKAGMSLQDFLSSPDGNKLAGPTGGVQGYKGTLFGIPYEAGSWQDKLIEAFAGTHDFIGGKLSGLYDEEGNAVRGRSAIEKFAHDRWSEAAIPISAPFAAAQALPPQVWQSLSVLLRNAK